MRSFVRQNYFIVSRKENPDRNISVYKTKAPMYKVVNEEKLTAIPVMSSGNALIYYTSHFRKRKTYD